MKLNRKTILIEGPDGVGKTTLAQTLSQAYNIPIIHLTYYKDKDKHEDQFKKVLELINNSINDYNARGFIIDRYILSSMVYSEVFQNEPSSLNLIDSYLDSLEFFDEIIIACPMDKERYKKHYIDILKSDRVEMYDDVDKMMEVYEYFKKYYNDKNEFDFLYNVDNLNLFDFF